jgi:hypothetical protein
MHGRTIRVGRHAPRSAHTVSHTPPTATSSTERLTLPPHWMHLIGSPHSRIICFCPDRLRRALRCEPWASGTIWVYRSTVQPTDAVKKIAAVPMDRVPVLRWIYHSTFLHDSKAMPRSAKNGGKFLPSASSATAPASSSSATETKAVTRITIAVTRVSIARITISRVSVATVSVTPGGVAVVTWICLWIWGEVC